MNKLEMSLVNDPKQNSQKIIYDIGANNGDDIPYYLKKSDLVIAVEANPDLCRQIQERFSSEIKHGRLILENCVLTAEYQSENVPFYLHKTNHVLSQFSLPKSKLDQFERVLLPSKSLNQLFKEHGFPYYVKIDIEGYDHVLLRSLLNKNIKPCFLSAESHRIEVFLLLTCLGGYNSFKVVNGGSIVDKYSNHLIKTIDGEEVYSFPHHSAGPFGDDISGNWINSEQMFHQLKLEGLGWKDLHVKKENSDTQQFKSIFTWQIKYWFYKIQWFTWKVYKKIKLMLLQQ